MQLLPAREYHVYQPLLALLAVRSRVHRFEEDDPMDPTVKFSKILDDTVLTRRSFMKWSTALGGTAALMQGGLLSGASGAGKAAARAD